MAKCRTKTAQAVEAKVRQLRLFQPEWEAIGPKGRKAWLLRFQNWILDNTEHIIDVLQSETGKTRVDACVEPPACADLINYWAGNAEKFLADNHPKAHSPLLGMLKKLTTVYRPYPLVGVITPWNLPVPVIRRGCDSGVGRRRRGAAQALRIHSVERGRVRPRVDRDRGAAGARACERLRRNRRGRRGQCGLRTVHRIDRHRQKDCPQCAERLIPYSLELSGKDAALVLADANLERAANGIAWGGLYNSGQLCCSVERVYVEEPVYDEFLAKLTEHVQELKQGQDGRRPKFDVGAMVTAAQRDIVARHVDQALAAGARVTTGGKPTGVGTFFEPTVLADVDQSMLCMTEETFGPTLPVVKVANEAEAIRLANDSVFGLSASVWTSDKDRGERVARQLKVGAVNINDALANVFSYTIPMGGWKQSGVGARCGGAGGMFRHTADCRPSPCRAFRRSQRNSSGIPTRRARSGSSSV